MIARRLRDDDDEAPLYEYEASVDVGGKSEKRQGVRRALDQQEVASHLLGRGMTVTKLRVVGRSEAQWRRGTERPKPELLAQFFRDFGLLAGSGANDFRKVFRAIAKPMRDRRFKEIVDSIAYGATQETSIADEMSRHPWAFTESQIALVRAGEAGAGIENTATDIADIVEEQIEVDDELADATQEGKISLSTLVLVLHGMIGWSGQMLLNAFSGPGKVTPPLLAFLAPMIHVYNLPVVTFLELMALVILWRPSLLQLLPQGAFGGEDRLDALALKLPLFGVVYRTIAQAWFASTMGILMKRGVDPGEALLHAIQVSGRPTYVTGLREIIGPFTQGVPLSELLRETGLFDYRFLVPLETAEEAGTDLADRLILIGRELRTWARRRLAKISRPLGAFIQYVVAAIALLMALGLGIFMVQIYISQATSQ